MSDNNLRISFDYKYPDTAVLIVYESWGGMLTSSPEIRIRKTFTSEHAVRLYAMLTGKTVAEVHKEAGYTKYDFTSEEREAQNIE